MFVFKVLKIALFEQILINRMFNKAVLNMQRINVSIYIYCVNLHTNDS